MALAAPGAVAHERGGEEHPLVIGHRGASGYLPEHTLQSYALAIKLGADYVEPDLVATKDGHLIARHEPDITNTTDVGQHPEFADRETTRPSTGSRPPAGSPPTSRSPRSRRCAPSRPSRSAPALLTASRSTLQEVIDLVKRESRKRDRRIGIYPETKHPTFHKDLGLALEPRLVNILDAPAGTAAGIRSSSSPSSSRTSSG